MFMKNFESFPFQIKMAMYWWKLVLAIILQESKFLPVAIAFQFETFGLIHYWWICNRLCKHFLTCPILQTVRISAFFSINITSLNWNWKAWEKIVMIVLKKTSRVARVFGLIKIISYLPLKINSKHVWRTSCFLFFPS